MMIQNYQRMKIKLYKHKKRRTIINLIDHKIKQRTKEMKKKKKKKKNKNNIEKKDKKKKKNTNKEEYIKYPMEIMLILTILGLLLIL